MCSNVRYVRNVEPTQRLDSDQHEPLKEFWKQKSLRTAFAAGII